MLLLILICIPHVSLYSTNPREAQNKERNIASFSEHNPIIPNKLMQERDSLSVRSNNIVPLSSEKLLGVKPIGDITNMYAVDGRLVIRGNDFLYINGTTNIFWANETIVDVDYADIDGDLRSECAVLTSERLYLIDDDLEAVWSANYDKTIGYNRILIAKLSTPGILIALWKYNDSHIAYYDINGVLLNETQLGISATLLSLTYSVDYFVGWVWSSDIAVRYDLVAWKYGGNVGKIVDEASPPLRIGNFVYVLVDYYPLGMYLCKTYNGSLEASISVGGSNAVWRGLTVYARGFNGFDADGDGSIEFVTYNNTHMVCIDTISDTSQTQQFSYILANVSVAYVCDQGVVAMRGDKLEFYNLDLTLRKTMGAPEGSYLIPSDGDVYTITPNGECMFVQCVTLTASYPFVSAGWKYKCDKNTLVVYNARRAELYWPDRIVVYVGNISNAIPMTRSALIVGQESVIVDYYGNVTPVSLNLSNAIISDYSGSYISVVLDNGTLINYNLETQVVSRFSPPIGFRPISVYCRDGDWYYAALKNYTNYANLSIYKSGSLWRQITITGPLYYDTTQDNIRVAKGGMVAGDEDHDGATEIAVFLYAKGYVMVNYTCFVFEDNYQVYSQADCYQDPFLDMDVYIAPSGYLFAFSSADKHIVRRVHVTGTSKVYYLAEKPILGCYSGIFCEDNATLFTSRGDYNTSVSDFLVGVGHYGVCSITVYLNASYHMLNMSFALDLGPPTITVSSPTNNSYLNTTAIFVNWNVTDDIGVDCVELVLDNGTKLSLNPDGNMTLSFSEGSHNITVIANDTLGRVSTCTLFFVVDVRSPTINIVSPQNGTIIKNSSVSIQWQIADQYFYTATLYLDGVPLETIGPMGEKTIYNLDSREHTITIIAYDKAGNRNTKTVWFIVDLDAPAIRFLSPQNNTRYTHKDVMIKWEISEDYNLSRAELYIDQHFVVEIGSSGEYIAEMSEGYHTIKILAVDTAGRVSTATVIIIVDLPLSAEANISCGNNTWLRTDHVNVSVMVFGSGNVTIIHNNQTILAEANTTFPIKLSIGINIIEIIVANFNDTITYKYIVGYDIEPPQIQLISPANNSIILIEGNRTRVHLRLNVTDRLSGIANITISFRGITTTIDESIELDLPLGDYYFVIGAYDVAGNHASIILHITVKKKSPSSTSITMFIAAMIIGLGVGTWLIRRKRRS